MSALKTSLSKFITLMMIVLVAVLIVQQQQQGSSMVLGAVDETPAPTTPIPSIPEEKPFTGITIETIPDETSTNMSGNTTCCNICPKPKIIVVPKYTTIKVPIRIPYPVLKPIPPRDDEVKCPADYLFVPPNKCTKTIIIKKKVNCPIGFVRVSDVECLRIVIIREKEVDKILCPPGYVPFTLKKDSAEYIKLQENLDDGSFFFTNSTKDIVIGCKKTTTDEEYPHFSCPKGYYHESPFHCVKTVDCPKKGGWVKTAGGKCIRTLFRCPSGFKKIGKYGLNCIKIKLPCPSGYKQSKRSSRLCLKTKIIIKIKCPKRMFYSESKKTCIWKKCQTVKCNVDLKCPKGQVPSLNSKTDCCPSCKPCTCSSEYHPVCTREGVTVFNLCTAKCLKLEVVHEGSCKITEIQKILKVCPPCEQCKNKKKRPVCGVDGVTYPNYCVAKCVTSGQFTLKRKGECSPSDCAEGEGNKVYAEFLPFFERVLKSELVSSGHKKSRSN